MLTRSQVSGAEVAIAGDEPHGADPEDTASHVERTMEQARFCASTAPAARCDKPVKRES